MISKELQTISAITIHPTLHKLSHYVLDVMIDCVQQLSGLAFLAGVNRLQKDKQVFVPAYLDREHPGVSVIAQQNNPSRYHSASEVQ